MGDLKSKLYSCFPYYIQNTLCSLQGYINIKQRFNDYFFEQLELLNKSQFASEKEILSYKEEHLFRTLDLAYKYVPFYKKFFNEHSVSPYDFKQLTDIEKFPILTKEHIRNHYESMISTSFDRSKLIHSHTSGSTGKALDFFTTEKLIPYQWAIWWRFRNRLGVSYGEKHLNCTGKLVVPISTSRPPFWRVNKPMNQWLINMQHISPDKIKYIAKMISDESFSYISGYPSIIYALATYIYNGNIQIDNSPRYVFSGAEKMYDNQKEIIKKVFPDIIISDHYGASESVCNASKCIHDSYHEDYELGLLECEDKHWLSPTEYEGNILGTGFMNDAMPLIRYRIGDSAIWSTEKCKCGLHSQVIRDIQGRIEDFVVTPEGTKIQRFDYLFKNTKDIIECQVVQEKLGEITFRVVKRDGYTIKTETEIIKGVSEIISPTLKCRFEYVPEIERTNTGKFKAVVSKLK